tara:strand:+ start:445 stop:1860 length:1416 start_codon:yes stop_codon:yes gene_type:complete
MSLVAAAVALSGTATAGTFTGNNSVASKVTANESAVVFSTEGFAKVTGTALQAGPVINYKLGAAYITGDELILTLGGAGTDSKTVLPTTIMVDTAEFNLISSTATVIKYRVVAGAAKAGSVFTIPQQKKTLADLSDSSKSGLVISATNLMGLTITPTATKNNGTDSHDLYVAGSAGKDNIFAIQTTQLGSVATKNVAVSTKLNAVIDGSTTSASKKFIGDLTDTVSYTYTAPSMMPTTALLGKNDGVNDLTAAATQIEQKVVLLTSSDLSTAGQYAVKSAVTGATVVAAATGFTVTYPKGSSIVGDTLTITPKSPATTLDIPATTFTLDLDEVTSGVELADALAAGAWTTQGVDTVEIPYMPYGTGLSQVVYATNKSASDVEVSAKATDEAGTVYNLGVIGTANASSVTKLSTDLKNGLAAKGFTDGKVAIVLTFRGNGNDVATGKIQVQSGYNANASDRGFVSNTSNGSN